MACGPRVARPGSCDRLLSVSARTRLRGSVSALPVRVGWLMLLDVVVVVEVIDHLATVGRVHDDLNRHECRSCEGADEP